MLVKLAVVRKELKTGNLVLTVEPNGIHQIGTYGPLQSRHKDVIHCLPALGESFLGDFKGIIELLVFLIEAFHRRFINFCNWQMRRFCGYKDQVKYIANFSRCPFGNSDKSLFQSVTRKGAKVSKNGRQSLSIPAETSVLQNEKIAGLS